MLDEISQEKFMRQAIALAKRAALKGEIPIAALVIREGKVIARAHNRRALDCDPTAHAEILALKKAGKKEGVWNLSGADMVVTLEPCAMCAGAIVNARIQNLYFGAFDHRFGYTGSLGNIAQDERLNHRVCVKGGILKDECLQPLQQFFKNRRNTE